MKPLFQFSPTDVERVLAREFTGDAHTRAKQLLESFAGEHVETSPARVQIAAMKLAAGEVKLLARYLDIACCDEMDVILPAEYPRYAHQVHVGGITDETALQQLIDEDTRQYLSWFEA